MLNVKHITLVFILAPIFGDFSLHKSLLLAVADAKETTTTVDSTIVPPDWDTFRPPNEVESIFIDPAFGTPITRMTNAGLLGPQVGGSWTGNSEICYFNIDGSYFISNETLPTEQWEGINGIGCFLYDGRTGQKIKMLGTGTMRTWWFRWALSDHFTKNGEYQYFDPVYTLYKYEGNEVRMYDVRNMNTFELLHIFSEYDSISTAGGEGDISEDGRFWCLDGNKQVLFIYDLIDDLKYPETPFSIGDLGAETGEGVDYATISTSGDYVVVAWGKNAALEPFHGIEVYDKNWNFLRQIHPGQIHWDVGYDAFGDEVVFTAASYGVPEFWLQHGINPGDIVSLRLVDGNIRLLKKMQVWDHFVVSANNYPSTPEFAWYSFWGDRSNDPDQVWYPLWGEIVGIATDGSQRVKRMLHSRSWPVEGQSISWWQPDHVVNRQGTKIVYRSTYGGPNGDLYMFDTNNALPQKPTGLGVQSADRTVLLSWNPNNEPDIEFYCIYRDTLDGFLPKSDTEIALITSTSTEFEDTTVVNDQQYFYRICAQDYAGQRGSFSDQVAAIPTDSMKVIRGSISYALASKPVSNVQVDYSGHSSGQDITDQNGYYSLVGIAAGGDYQVTPNKIGDVGPDVIIAYDAALTAQAAIGLITLTPDQSVAADADSDGYVRSLDASHIARYVVGLANLDPSKVGQWIFSPPRRQYTPLPENQSHQDFSAIIVGDVDGNWNVNSGLNKVSGVSTFTTGVRTVPDSQMFSLVIPFPPDRNIISCDLELTFDPSELEYSSVELTGEGQKFNLMVNSQMGVVKIALYSAHPLKLASDDVQVLFVHPEYEGYSTTIAVNQFRIDNDCSSSAQVLVGVPSANHGDTQGFRLGQNYPNPFNQSTTIEFDLPQRAFVKLTLYDILGQAVHTYLDQQLDRGKHRIRVESSDLASGVYFYKITTKQFVETKKFVVIK